jgi:hypothetical protein
MIFNHDSDFDEEKREFFIDEKVRDKVYEKYSRRIKRMYEKIEEADRIIFFRTAPGYEFEKQKKIHIFNEEKEPDFEQKIMNELKEILK